ncbi:hypothetical protein BD770DRAFT_389375 [Pilaira anomala]|nr:hypothetical protein BD770DRAFT_389375 [Pilaira anomala]
MRLFKKLDSYQNQSLDHLHQELDRFRTQKSYDRADTLTHVMHLFGEKNKYSATPVTGPLPIKANGAIVVNRPSKRHSQTKSGTVRSLPIYLQDVPYKEEEEEEEEEEKEAEVKKAAMVIKKDIELIKMVHEENKRLRQQVLLEREQYERWRIERDEVQEELKFAHQTIKNMQRIIDRFQKLILPEQGLKNHIIPSKRRQSTGVRFDYINSSQEHVVRSYEHKIQILLNEIDAMEIQENQVFKAQVEQINLSDQLKQRLKYKDEIIRQLGYDLQVERRSRLV